MEAANRGASEEGQESIGLNIVLPHEQLPNPYVTPDLSFQFHYFALRKMHFLLRARAVAVFPGGFGTFDEFFELLTLIQTGKVRPLPILLFGRDFWSRMVNFEGLAEEGVIAPHDLDLFHWCEDADEAWDFVQRFYEQHPRRGAVDSAAGRPPDGSRSDELGGGCLRAPPPSAFGCRLPVRGRSGFFAGSAASPAGPRVAVAAAASLPAAARPVGGGRRRRRGCGRERLRARRCAG